MNITGHNRIGPIVCVVLVAIGAVRDAGLIGVPLANGLSLFLMLAAVVRVGRGPKKWRNLGELYLWLAFILSLLLLKDLAQSLALWLGREELPVFRVIAVIHASIVIFVLWRLGAWSRRKGETTTDAVLVRLAAGLWIAGAVVFWNGARTFPGMTLEAIATQTGGFMWTATGFLLATLITLAGLVIFTAVLRGAGERVFSMLGLCSFAFGAVFWVLHLCFRLTVLRQAAEEYGRTGDTPPWIQPWLDWNGLLFGIFSVLAYLGIAAYGGALLRTGLVARWLGRSCVVVGLLAAPLIGPPFFIHAVFWVLGIQLLTRVRQH